MEFLIYGFQADIRRYEMREILGWLIVVSLLHLAVGNYIARRKVHNEYMKLVRQGKFSRWWHRLCIRVLCFCFVSAALIFGISLVYQIIIWGTNPEKAFGDAFWQAFFLFFLNVCFISTFQMLVVNLGQGDKLSYLVAVVVEVVSIYGGIVWGNTACWLPGSWKMYVRSSLFDGTGYNVLVISVLQAAWVAACCLMGYKILDRRR